MIFTFVLLALAIVSLWFGNPDSPSPIRRHVWCGIGAASLVAALASGIVEPVALFWIGGFGGAVYAFSRPNLARGWRAGAVVVIVVLAGGLMLHVLPGFDNPRVIGPLQISSDAIPFRLHLNYDKTLVGLFLLGWCHRRLSRASEWRSMLASAGSGPAATIVLLIALSVMGGYVRFEPKLPPVTPLWLAGNLLFTCVAEEAVFRSFVQGGLQRLWGATRHGALLALVIASVFFGVAHAGGGAAYVALATVAGLGYGWVYQRTGAIEASILTHFALNAVHFIFFTYPALQ